MIRIERSSCPTVLRGAATDSDQYRHPDVVRELWEMQREKCCYCERKIPNTGHTKAVEHFAPKSVFKALRNCWANLLLACSQCNGKKGSQFPVMLTENSHEEEIIYVKEVVENPPALIDPSKINPEVHLDYHVDLNDVLFGQICPRGGSVLGKTTISVTGIDEPFFFTLRRAHVRMLCRAFIALDEARDNGDQELIATAVDRLKILLSSGSEFAGLAREFARKMSLDTEYGVAIPDIH